MSEEQLETEPFLHLHTKITASIEGGIGISPFLAILSDILHLIDDVSLLQRVDMRSIHPFFSDALNIEIQTMLLDKQRPHWKRVML
ncbi:Hypothetical predicted protein [Olea europaea subsp. europaea]|uniref:Uncharacterized protein n=1 Tax=Olea europaea subsp. europaea TaxID=158383 RepID=A0A8S0UCT1_OLEEU|nr:Hypothetical predicted protein [Olea europaea subsp. europaea]